MIIKICNCLINGTVHVMNRDANQFIKLLKYEIIIDPLIIFSSKNTMLWS